MKERMVLGIVLLLFAVAGGCAQLREKSDGSQTISAAEARRLIESNANVVVLDVRTPEEWKSSSGHLPNSLLIPIQDLESRLSDLEPFRGKTIITYCRSGNRSGRAAKILSEKGFKALNMEGGILKWNAEQFPVVKEVMQ